MTVVGPPGPPGRDGLNGTDGIDGRDGQDGRDGRDGQKVSQGCLSTNSIALPFVDYIVFHSSFEK